MLTVLHRVKDRVRGTDREAWWRVKCKCGRKTSMRGYMLRDNRVHSCGCQRGIRHGLCHTPEYKMWIRIKAKSMHAHIPFNIEISDIIIPKRCPLLGIPLFPGKKYHCPNSPSIDKIRPERGYVKGNIQVISHRANAIKQNASLRELQKITKNMEKILGAPLH